MGDRESDVEPEKNSADKRVERVRDRTMNLLADAAVHVQRVEDVAQKLGLTADLVDGLGDYVYEAVAAQLELASQIVERSRTVADRLFALRPERLKPQRLIRLEATLGKVASHTFRVSNGSARSADVIVEIDASKRVEDAATPKTGRPLLLGGRETWVEIAIDTKTLQEKEIYSGTIRAWLKYEGSRRVEVYSHDFELWVKAAVDP